MIGHETPTLDELVRRYRRPASQTLSLYGASFVVTALGFLISWLYARRLSVEDFGEYRYILNFILLAGTVLNLGFQYSSSTMIARESSEERIQRLIGATIVLELLACGLGGLLVLVGVPVLNGLVRPGLVHSGLAAAAPFLFIGTFQLVVMCILRGQNRIHELSWFTLMPQVLVLAASAALVFGFRRFNLSAALAVYFAVNTLVTAVRCFWMRPRFSALRESAREIWAENRANGFPMYIGGLSGVATGQLIVLLTAAYVSKSEYGCFSLALSLANPLAVIPSVVGTVMFRSNATRSRMSSRVIGSVCAISAGTFALFAVASWTLLVPVFGSRFHSSVGISVVLGLAAMVYGLGDFLHRFISAKGHGVMLRNGAFLTGGMNIVAGMALLPLLGMWGGTIARTLAGLVYLASMWWYYRRLVRQLAGVTSGDAP